MSSSARTHLRQGRDPYKALNRRVDMLYLYVRDWKNLCYGSSELYGHSAIEDALGQGPA